MMTQTENVKEVVYKPTSDSEFLQKLKSQNIEKKDNGLFLYFAAVIVNLLPFMVGVTTTWTSPVSLKLLSPDPNINPLGEPVTPVQLALIGSFPSFGGMTGLVLLGSTFDNYGRRKVMMALSFIMTVSFLILAFATNIYFYYTSLLIVGVALGAGMVGTTMFSGEMTEDHNRAKFACFIELAMPLGNLFTFIIGPFFSVKVFTLLCAMPSLIHFLCFFVILPESPVHLLTKEDIQGTKQALRKFRSKSSQEIEQEIEIIQFTLKNSTEVEGSGLGHLMRNRATRKALIIGTTIFAFSLFSTPSIVAFLDLIFKEAGTNVSGFASTLAVAIVQVIGCVVASVIVEIFGRRQLMLTSSIFCSVPLIILGIFFQMKTHHFSITESLGWLPITSLVIYFIFFVIGLGTVPLVFISEVFPANVKSLATSIVISNNFIVVGLTIFLFPIIMANFGLAWNFFIMGLISALGFIFIYYTMPETKGKTFLEIQDTLSK